MSTAKKLDFKTPGARRIATNSELKKMERDLEDRQGERKLARGRERSFGYMAERHDDPLEQKTIDRVTRVIKNQSRQDLNQEERKRWEATGKQLEEWLINNMMPRSRLNVKRSDPEFHKIANQLAACENSAKYSENAERWVNIMRQLHPHDVYKSSLESIRPR